jgi:hypothetical protein
MDTMPTPVMPLGTMQEAFDRQTNEMISLKSNLDSMTKNWEFQRDRAFRMSNQIEQFENALKDHLEHGYIDHEIAIGYADMFDISLDREVAVNMTIVVTGTARIPFDTELDSINWDNEVEVDIRSYGQYDLDVYVDTIDADVEEI